MSGVLSKGSCEHGVPPAPMGRCTECSVEARVIRVVARELGAISREITDDATFEALGADSLHGISIAMALEDEFCIEIPDDTIIATATVREAIEAVEALLK